MHRSSDRPPPSDSSRPLSSPCRDWQLWRCPAAPHVPKRLRHCERTRHSQGSLLPFKWCVLAPGLHSRLRPRFAGTAIRPVEACAETCLSSLELRVAGGPRNGRRPFQRLAPRQILKVHAMAVLRYILAAMTSLVEVVILTAGGLLDRPLLLHGHRRVTTDRQRECTGGILSSNLRPAQTAVTALAKSARRAAAHVLWRRPNRRSERPPDRTDRRTPSS